MTVKALPGRQMGREQNHIEPGQKSQPGSRILPTRRDAPEMGA
jgi:hypothetical protein